MPANRKIDELMSQGLGLHQAGRLADAEAIYRRVLKSEPSHAAGNHLIGLALLQQGKPELAVPHLKRAVQMRSNDPDYHANLGVALNAANRPLDALPAFEQALRLKPDFAAALNNRGLALRKLERHADAAASYRQALAVHPNEAGFLRNLGNVLTATGDLREAEAVYREALRVQPDHPNAVTGLCIVLEMLGRADEAIAVATAQIARNPQEPECHRALAHANWVARHPEAAAVGYRSVIALRPADAEAHRMLGTIVRRTEEDDEVRALHDLIARTDLGEDQRSQLEFAVGQAYDDLGDFDRAFTHLSRGNALQAQLRPFDLGRAQAEIDLLRRFFDGLPDDQVPALQPPTGPILIVGLPRSGKTSLEGMLSRHPDLAGLGELPILGNLVAELRRDGEDGGAGAGLTGATSAALADLGTRYATALAKITPVGRRPLDTMPNNFLLVGFLRLALPAARVINCAREPVGHAAALFGKYFAQTGNEYASDLGAIAAYSELYRGLSAYWQARFPGFVIEVDLVGAVRSSEPGMRQILDHVGASWCPACLDPYEAEPRIGSPIVRAPATEQRRLQPYRLAHAGPDGGRDLTSHPHLLTGGF